jgi:DNA-binding beta-propeller fold protein YncE
MTTLYKRLATIVATGLTAGVLSCAAQAGQMFLGAYPNSLIVVDESNGSVVNRIMLSSGLPTAMRLSQDKKKLFVTTNTRSGIEVIDVATKKVITSFSLNTDTTRYRFTGGTPDPTGKFFYTLITEINKEIDHYNVQKPKIGVIDIEQKKVAKMYDIAKEDEGAFRGFGRGNLEISPDGKYLYQFGEKVLIMDTTDFKVVDRIELSKTDLDGLADGTFGGTLDSISAPGEYQSLFNAADPYVHNKVFGIGKFDLNKRKFEFTPIGPAPQSMAGLQVSPDKREAYTIATTGGNLGNKRCEFWRFDVAKNTLRAKSEFSCKTRFYFSMSANGKKLYIYGASFDLEVYDAITLKHERTYDLNNDVTMAGLITLN